MCWFARQFKAVIRDFKSLRYVFFRHNKHVFLLFKHAKASVRQITNERCFFNELILIKFALLFNVKVMQTKKYFRFMLLVASLIVTIGCSKNEDNISDNSDHSTDDEEIDVSSDALIGYWKCTYQQWKEAGEEWHSTYDDTDQYYICFNDDFTGYLDSEEDQLMEVMGYEKFSWSVAGNKIITQQHKWQVKKLSENELVLYWEDGEYNITCNFIKNSGTYKPVVGHCIKQIEIYNMRNGTSKERLRFYYFQYDSQNRISQMTYIDDNGHSYIYKYEYRGEFVRIDGWMSEEVSLGKNGYVKSGLDIKYEDVHKWVYNNDGKLIDIEFGESLNKGRVHYEYNEDAYICTLYNAFNKVEESYQYDYNVEFVNNSSVNLVALYIYRDYLPEQWHAFDFVGKRPLYMVKKVTPIKIKGGGLYYTNKYLFIKDKLGRVTQIKEDDPISYDVWDIKYID